MSPEQEKKKSENATGAQPSNVTPAAPSPTRAPTLSQVDQERAEGEGMGLGSLQPESDPSPTVPSDELPRTRESQ